MSFFSNVWSFILTLVRSLLAFFSFRRRASDPFSLPRVNRTPKDALSRLRPILLTPRSITTLRAQSIRTRSATSTLFPAPDSVPQSSGPQRTSPKLDPHDAELGLSVTAPGPPAASVTSTGTPDSTSLRTSVHVSPLTPPDRCYLAPLPSVSDCPYTEPWPTNVALDRGQPRVSGSPLKASINMVPPFPESMGSPPPGRWGPVQIWMSTPCKNDSLVPDLALSPFEFHKHPSPATAKISHALISRSRNSIQLYDDSYGSSPSSDASLFVDYSNGPLRQPGPTRERHRTHARAPRSKIQPYPQFHHPDAYAYAWRRHGARLPGKHNRTHAHARSHSHMDLPASEWYDADAYAPSPVSVLSPPRSESATEDEDEMPLGRLRERLARRSAAVGLGMGAGTCKATAMSPRTRRMSEGCMLAISESTPTRIGVSARSSRHMHSMAFDGHGYNSKDWLEALSLRFSSDQKDALAQVPEPCMAVPSVDVVAG